MLLTREVEVTLAGSNVKWYEEKGYIIPRRKNKWGRLSIPPKTKIKVKVEDLPKYSKTLVEVECDNPNCTTPINKPWTWSDYLIQVHEDGTTYCFRCGKKLFGKDRELKTRLKDGKNSFGYWLIKNLPLRKAIELILRWDEEKNGCDIRDINYTSHGIDRKGYWFKCIKHPEHGSELKNIANFTTHYKNYNDTIILDCIKCNSFAQWGYDNVDDEFLEKYWDYEKNIDKNGNGINPWKIPKCSNKKVWLFCQIHKYHGSYDIQCNDFYNGARCGYCGNLKVHPLDSIGQYIIDNYGQDFLNSIWSEKNKKSPFEYSPYSKEKAWWKCPDEKHENFKRSIGESNIANFRCPYCTNEMKESIIENKTKTYLEFLNYNVLTEHYCTLVPKNPKTKHSLPFDNEVKLINGIYLICEVNGIQHYEELPEGNSWLNGDTPKEHLHKIQLHDRYKQFIAYKNGYEYLELPYWAFDKQNTYKKLIDNKINEILNKN